MTTPMIVICLLLLSYLAAWVIGGNKKTRFGGILGISLAFFFFGIGHYTHTDAMVAMLPDFVPFRRPIILGTGLLEFAIAGGFLFPATRVFSGVLAVAVLIAFFPSNIYAAVNHTGMGGHVWGPIYLLIRAPLQALLVWWTWFFAIREFGGRISSGSP